MNVEAKFTHEKVDHSKEHELGLVVTLKAPKIEWEKERAPICVIPVVDVSTSMSGEKLENAKQSVLKLVENLQPGDYCGLVAFGSDVYPIAEPREMTQSQKDDLRVKVGRLHPVGCTNFSGGMRQGLEWLAAADVPANVVCRVIMFTDGHANQGEAQGHDLIPLCKKLLGRATLSAFGYGDGADQELLADLATAGKGNYAFIRNPDDAMTAFAKELGGLLSRYAQDICLDMAPFNGHEITEVVSDVEVEGDGKKVKVKIPEILSEEERHIVLTVKTSEQSKALPRSMNVVDILATYSRIIDGDKTSHTEEVKAKLYFVKAGEEQREPTKEVMDIVGLAKIVQAQIESEQHANRGDFAAAQAVMCSAAMTFDSMGMDEHRQYATSLGDKMSSSTTYSANSGYLRSARKSASRSVEASDVAVVADMGGLKGGMCFSNTAQDAMVENFNSGSPQTVVSGTVSVSRTAKKPAKKNGPKMVSKNRSKRW